MKKTAKAIYILLIAAVIGLFVYIYFTEGSLDYQDLFKGMLVILAALGSLFGIRNQRSTGDKKAMYQKAYSDFIQDPFPDDKRLQKKFYSAVDDYNRNKPADALKKLTQLRKNCQSSSELYAVTVFTALCYDEQRLCREAINHYEAALGIRENSTLQSNMGLMYDRLGDYDSALKAYQRAVLLDPKNATAHNNIAQQQMRLGEYEAALKSAETAHRLNQRLIPALNALAICHYMLGNQEEYQRYLRQAAAAGSDAKSIKAYIARIEEAD